MNRIAAIVAGIAFAAFPIVRPWGDKSGSTQEMAQAFADPRWVIAHCLGMLGWIALSLALRSTTRSAGWLLGGGTMLLLPYYGAETFGLHGLATTDPSFVTAQEAIRMGAVQTTMFACGLLLAAAGGVRLLIASTPRWPVALLALGLLTYLPQFFTPAPVRIAHGVALGLGCVVWALTSRTPETMRE